MRACTLKILVVVLVAGNRDQSKNDQSKNDQSKNDQSERETMRK